MQITRSLASLCILATLLLGACGAPVAAPPVSTQVSTPVSAQVATPVATRPLKIGWTIWAGYYPIIIAAEKGFFTKHGVAVEPILLKNSNGISQVASGELDGMLSSLSKVLGLDSTSPDVGRIVLVSDYSDGADVVVADASIKTPADLRGKQIGAILGIFSELFVRRMLEQYNVSPQEVTLVNTKVISVPSELAQGTIQAGHTWDPYKTEALQQGAHVIFSSAEVPGLISDVMVMRTDVTKTRPEDVRALLLAWFEAVDYWKANPEECKALIAKAAGVDIGSISLDGIRLLSLADNQQAFTQDDKLLSLYTSAKLQKDFLISTGTLTAPPNEQRLLDKSFLPQ